MILLFSFLAIFSMFLFARYFQFYGYLSQQQNMMQDFVR